MQLVANQLIRPCQPSRANTHAYGTHEVKKGASRLRNIMNTFGENSLPSTRPPHRITPVPTMIRRFMNKQFSSSRDFKSFFHQFLVRPDRFTFDTSEGPHTLLRMPMGHQDAATIAHLTSLVVVTLAIQFAGASDAAVYDVIIDDVTWATDDRVSCDLVGSHFDKLCEQFLFTIGTRAATSTVAEHRGVIVDQTAKSATLRPAFVTKHQERLSVVTPRPTAARLRSMCGTLVYYSYTTGYLVSQMPAILRATVSMTRASTSTSLSEAASLILPAYQLMLQNAPFSPTRAPPIGGFLFSDATPTSYAAIYVNSHGDITYTKGRFEAVTDISSAEAFATIAGMVLVPRFDDPRGITIVFGIDNQGWLYGAQRPWLMSPLHGFAMTFRDQCLRKNITPSFTYTPTHLQPADDTVRDRGTHAHRVLAAIQHVPSATLINRCTPHNNTTWK